MKAITNLNLLDVDKLLIDDEDRLFIVLECDTRHEGTCSLKLIELNEAFTRHSMTVPIACNKELEFISINDKDFTYKFNEIEVTKAEISKLLSKEIRAKIEAETKKQK